MHELIAGVTEVIAHGARQRCESVSAWAETANPWIPSDRIQDGRLRVEVMSIDGTYLAGLVVGGTVSEHRFVIRFVDQHGCVVQIEGSRDLT